MEVEHDEKEFDDVVEILKRLYDGEKYWFDPDLINNTIKAFKEVVTNKLESIAKYNVKNKLNLGVCFDISDNGYWIKSDDLQVIINELKEKELN